MPEALALLAVAFIALLIVVITWLTLRPAPAAEERERLHARIAWLEDRASHAAAKSWDDTMRGHIAAELAASRAQLDALDRAAAAAQSN